MKERLKRSTWLMKTSVIDQKILPYFRKKKVQEIKPTDIIAWQNVMLTWRDENGRGYSPTYLKTIHNQCSAIFNHAVRYYELKSNPAAKAGNMGKEKTKEMLFWTKPEYQCFSDAMMDKPVSFYAFEILYWCGLRLGEMLALTAADFDFVKNTVRINTPASAEIAPHIVSLTAFKLRSETLLHSLSASGVYVSSGSACSSNGGHSGYVLRSFGLPEGEADSTIRISFGDDTTEEAIDALASALRESITRLAHRGR